MDNEIENDDTTQEDEGVTTPSPQTTEPDWMSMADASYEAVVNVNSRFRIQSTTAIRDVPCLTDDQGGYKAEILGTILDRSHLTFGTGTVFQLDGANIGYGQLIQPGSLIVAIGSVKGGNA